MTTFQKEIQEVKNLNNKYQIYWEKEFDGMNYSDKIADPDNFEDCIFYHQANSDQEKNLILKNGFDINKIQKSNCGVGAGLYLGRDKKALISFYDPNWSYLDFTLKIVGNFNFYDAINSPLPKNPIKVLEQGFDGIRYFDPDATGEEFVLFNLQKVHFTV